RDRPAHLAQRTAADGCAPALSGRFTQTDCPLQGRLKGISMRVSAAQFMQHLFKKRRPRGCEQTTTTQFISQQRNTAMRRLGIFGEPAAFLVSAPAIAQDVKVGIGISGWTGFAPLTLANQAGIFKKNGLDVTIKKIPQKDRHLAIASGDIQCAATTVETWIVWNANGVATKQIFQLDKSY